MEETAIRPPANKKKIHSKDEFELCYIRHQYLRRVTYNPSEKEMEPYMAIVKHMAYNTFNMYRNLFALVGFDLIDVINIGRIHLVSFLGLFSLEKMEKKYKEFVLLYKKLNGIKPDKDVIQNKNKANLTMFLKQRMEDVVRVCRQKAKNIKGMAVEEAYAYYGTKKPPKNHRLLLEDNEKYGFKKIDFSSFKSIRKKLNKIDQKMFKFSGYWYVCVPLEHRNLTLLDLSCAGLDPHDSIHNMNPEQILFYKHEEEYFNKKKAEFDVQSDDMKIDIMKQFIQKNKKNPTFKEEIKLAKKFIKDLRV